MKLKEFKEWLNQFSDDTLIEVVYHTNGHGYYDQGGNAIITEFNPDLGEWGYCGNGHCEYTDYNKLKTLRLGGYNE